MTHLVPAATDLAALRRRVSLLAEDRPAVYRMINPVGQVIYVGKSKKLRTRLLTYFRASFPYDKAARILTAAADIRWDYQPSDFAAHLSELRHIKSHRPLYNVRMNRSRSWVLIKVSGGPAPKLYVGNAPSPGDVMHYGPFPSPTRVRDAVRTLNDLLGLRDCVLNMPIAYPEQGDLFGGERRACCIRYELNTCSGPCGALVSEIEYRRKVRAAVDFLEGRSIKPLDQIVTEMDAASEENEFELATLWRTRFDSIEWLFAAINRARAAIDSLSFVYTEPGAYGEEMSYVIDRARVRAAAPAPRTPIEREAFKALVVEHSGRASSAGPIPADDVDETLLLLSWFRNHPGAIRRTIPFERWLAPEPQQEPSPC